MCCKCHCNLIAVAFFYVAKHIFIKMLHAANCVVCGMGNSMRESLVNSLNLPKDVMLGATTIHLTGHYTVVVENFDCILDYDSTQIIVRTKDSKIKICGEYMEMDYLSDYDFKVSGRISQIIFV